MPQIQWYLQMMCEKQLKLQEPGALPQCLNQSNAMACLPHQNLVSGQTVNQTESAFVSVKLSPFNLLFFFNSSTIKKIFILEK